MNLGSPRARLGVLVAGLALAGGCAAAPKGSTAEGARAGVVSGMVYVEGTAAVPKGASVKVELVDATDINHVLTVARMGQDVVSFPVAFKLRFDPGAVVEGHLYQVRAELDVSGKTPWTHEQKYPVLTSGYPAYVEVRLTPRW